MPDASPIGRLVEDFLTSSRAAGLSRKTLEAYGTPLRQILLPFCAAQVITELAELDQKALDRLAVELQDRPSKGKGDRLSPYSVKAYLKSVNQFLSWARKQGLNAPAAAQLPRTRRKALDTLTRAEIDTLEAAAPNERDKLIIRLMGDTGAREGEIASLKTSSLLKRDRDWYVKVSGKTGERLVPILAAVASRLVAYRTYGRPRAAMDDGLFLSLRRRPRGNYEPLTVGGVYQVVKEAASRAGFEKRVYPHLLRHSAITYFVSRNMNPVAISDITGCSTQMIATVYAHLGHEDRHSALVRALSASD